MLAAERQFHRPGDSTLLAFVGLAYALTWILLAPWFYAFNVVYHEEIPGWMWAFAPLAFIGGWGPSVAGLIVSLRTGGRDAVRLLARSLLAWRQPWRWYLMTFALPPLLTAAALLIVDRGTVTLRQFDGGAAAANLPLAYALALPFGPMGEELGWRGVALPRLLSSFGPVKASLLLGGIWTFWHVPMMLWSPGASLPSFMGLSVASVVIYLIQLTAETALMTLLFLRTNGSVFMAILAHLTLNTSEAVLFGGLPPQPAEHLHRIYIVNVALLAGLGVISLAMFPSRSNGRLSAPEEKHHAR